MALCSLSRLRVILAAAAMLAAHGAFVAAQEKDTTRESPAKSVAPSREIVNLITKGRFLRNQSNYDAALDVFNEVLIKARSAKDRAGEAMALTNIASVYRYRATETKSVTKSAELAGQAINFYQQALPIAREANDKHDEGYALLYLGVLAAQRGQADQSLTFYESALPLFTTLEDNYYVARTLMFMGKTKLYLQDQPAQALPLYERCLSAYRSIGQWDEAIGILDDMKAAYERLAKQSKKQSRRDT